MTIGQIAGTTSGSGLWCAARLAMRALLLAVALAAASPSVQAQTATTPSADATAKRASPITPSSKLDAPSPPEKAGCHHLVDGKWQEIPCASDQYLREHRMPAPAMVNGIQSLPQGLSPSAHSHRILTIPLVRGSVAIGFLSDPTQATEATVTANKPNVSNAFSIQTNTNVFACTLCGPGEPFQGVPGVPHSASQSGDRGWVQFSYQDFGSTWRLCIWSIDSTVVRNTGNVSVPTGADAGFSNSGVVGYNITCVAGLPVMAPLTGAQAPKEEAKVIGYAVPASGSTTAYNLELLAYLPWSGSEGWWSINTPDALGLHGHWTTVSGTILGSGHGAKAVFSANARIQQVVQAYSCFLPERVPGAATGCPPANIPLHAAVVSTSVTAESNNLTNEAPRLTCEMYNCSLTYNSKGP